MNKPQRYDCNGIDGMIASRNGDFVEWDDYAALAAENERLRKAGEWQPIKTAPKDGTHILTCGDGYIVVAMWFVYHGGRSQWETVDGESEIDPTHWMPLPSAPASKEGKSV